MSSNFLKKRLKMADAEQKTVADAERDTVAEVRVETAMEVVEPLAQPVFFSKCVKS